jgi:uncharacterized protein (TIGR03437 family)
MKRGLRIAPIVLQLLGNTVACYAAGQCSSIQGTFYNPQTSVGPSQFIPFPGGGTTPYSPTGLVADNTSIDGLVPAISYPAGKEPYGTSQTLSAAAANQILNRICPGLGIVVPPSLRQLRPDRPAQTTSGVPIVVYGVGSEPIVAGDFNNDGHPDTAQVQNGNGGQVIVELLDSGGNVLSTSQYAVSSTANEIVAGDFNGDGFLDLAVGDDGGGSASGGIWILLNNGDGTFKTAVKTPGEAGPYHLFAADFNGDGHIDVAASNDQSPTVSVFFGNGDGTLQAATSLGGLQAAGSLVAADFRGIGRSDIAVIDFLANSVVIFPSNSDGSFREPLSFPAGYGPGYLMFADLNNDGIPDLAASYLKADSAVLLINNGSEGFTASPPYLLGTDPASLALLYLGGPIALLSGNNIPENVLIQFGPGDGTLNAPQLVYTGEYPIGVAAGDVNGDGKDDAVVLERATGGFSKDAAYLLINSGNGTFASPVTYSVPSPTAAAFAALTRGGKPDLVVASSSGTVQVLPNNDQGGFGAAIPFLAGTDPSALAIADFNADGNPDVAVANGGSATSGVSVLLGDGEGGLTTVVAYLPMDFASAIASADLNHDGLPDLIAATGLSGVAGNPDGLAIPIPQTVTVLLNQANGVFTALSPINLLPAGGPSSNGIFQIVTGDFNGDGKIDLAVIEKNGVSQIQILLGNGDGTFQTGAVLPTESGANTAVAADFNGDGVIDLIVGHCCGDTDDTYLEGNGDGTFQPEIDFPSGASPEALALADWSGAGTPDLAIVGQMLQGMPGTKGFFLPLNNSFPPAVVSGASFRPGPIAPSEIVTLKGGSLASFTASLFPLQTTVDGVSVTLTDSTGFSQAAPLYYVSPGQINLEVPANVALGQGSVSLTKTDGTTAIDFVQFAASAPGVFQLNSSSLAAAEVLVVNGSRQTLDQVYQLGPGNSVIPLPIDLSQGQVYLELFGTGIRNAKTVTITVAGQSVPVIFSGAQGTFAGEDQVNAGPLPASLAGSGSVNIVLTADGQAANTVNVTIQ